MSNTSWKAEKTVWLWSFPLGGLTDKLLATAALASSGDQRYKDNMLSIAERHRGIITAIIAPEFQDEVSSTVEPMLEELGKLYDGVALIGELPRPDARQDSELRGTHVVSNRQPDDSRRDALQFSRHHKDGKMVQQEHRRYRAHRQKHQRDFESLQVESGCHRRFHFH